MSDTMPRYVLNGEGERTSTKLVLSISTAIVNRRVSYPCAFHGRKQPTEILSSLRRERLRESSSRINLSRVREEEGSGINLILTADEVHRNATRACCRHDLVGSSICFELVGRNSMSGGSKGQKCVDVRKLGRRIRAACDWDSGTRTSKRPRNGEPVCASGRVFTARHEISSLRSSYRD